MRWISAALMVAILSVTGFAAAILGERNPTDRNYSKTEIPGDFAGTTVGINAIGMSASLRGGGFLPPCLATDNCLLDCGVGIVTGGDIWECKDGNNAAVSVTAGAGTTFEVSGFNGTKAARISTDAMAPSLTGTVANTALGANFYTNPFTVVAIASGDTTNDPGLVSHGPPTTRGILMADNSAGTTSRCIFVGIMSQQPSVGGKWSVQSCRHSGANGISRSNGFQNTSAQGFVDTNAGDVLYFGRNTTAAHALNGLLGRVRFYSRSLSDTEVTAVENSWYGTIADTAHPIGFVRASTQWCTDQSGSFYAVADGGACIHPGVGMLIEEARTNYWLNSLIPASWAVVGTPVITAASASGKGARMTPGGNDLAKVCDDDAVSVERVQSGDATAGGNADYVVSVDLRNDNLDTAILDITTDGTGSTTCTINSITTATCAGCLEAWRVVALNVTRFSCKATVGGAATTIRGRLAPGDNVVGTQGCVFAAFPQIEKGTIETSFIGSAGVALQRTISSAAISSAGIPIASGFIEARYSPRAANGLEPDGRRIWNNRNGVDGNEVSLAAGAVTLRVANGGGASTTNAGWTSAARQAQNIYARWGGTIAYLQRGTTTPVTNTAQRIPTAVNPTTFICGFSAAANPCNGWISDFHWGW